VSYGRGRYFVYARNIRVKVQEEPSGRWIAHYARTGDGSKRTVNGQVFGQTRKDLFRKMRIEISAHMNPGVHAKVGAATLRAEVIYEKFVSTHPKIREMGKAKNEQKSKKTENHNNITETSRGY